MAKNRFAKYRDATNDIATPEAETAADENRFAKFRPGGQVERDAAQHVPNWMDAGQGAVQGGLDQAQQYAQDLGGDRSQPPMAGRGGLMGVSDMIGQIPGAAIDLMTGGRGGQAMRDANFAEYGPGVPPTPEGQLGAEVGPVAAGAVGGLGGMAGRAGLHAARGGAAGMAERQLAKKLETPGQPKSAYGETMMDELYPGGNPGDKSKASALFEAGDKHADAQKHVMSPTQKPPKHLDINKLPPKPQKAAAMPQAAYRERVKELLSGPQSRYVDRGIQRKLMKDDGMTVKEYNDLRQEIGTLSTKPRGQMAIINEAPADKAARRAYAEAANALDEMKMPPGNVALEMYGEGREIWRVASNYERAKDMVEYYTTTGADGVRNWNSVAFQKALDKMKPETVREVFGEAYAKVVNASRRVSHRGFKARQKAKQKLSSASWTKFRNWGLLAGVGYSVTHFTRDVRTQVVGSPMVRKHSDR